MYEVEIITGFSGAHRLREYKGKCERLHGHNYRIHVTARSASPGAGGMVIDFGDLKEAANRVIQRRNAKKLLSFLIPYFWQILYLNLPL